MSLDELKASKQALIGELMAAGAKIGSNGKTVWCPFHASGGHTHEKSPSGSIHEHQGAFQYTCHGGGTCGWNDGKITGDVIAVTMAYRKMTFAEALAHHGVENRGVVNRSPTPSSDDAGTAAPGSDPEEIKQAEEAAALGARQLLDDGEALNDLWKSRAISRDSVEQLGLGIAGQPDRLYVTMPVRDVDGTFVGIKSHALNGQTPKSWWRPRGVSSAQCFPLDSGEDGIVFLCPGELKAAAVHSLNLPVVGITAGESADLPAWIVAKLAGRKVALPADDDTAGKAWGERIQDQLKDSDARVIDLGFDTATGTNDIGDWLVRELVTRNRPPEEVRQELLAAFNAAQLAPHWASFSFRGILRTAEAFKPTTSIVTGLQPIDDMLGGGLRTGGVHLMVGRPGDGKTQTVAQIANNVADQGVPTAVFTLELSRFEFARLMVAQRLKVRRSVLDYGKVDEQQALQLKALSGAERDLFILDDDRWKGALDREALAEHIARGVKRFHWRLVILDYLGLLALPSEESDQFQGDMRNSSALKRIARQHDIAILAVSAVRKPKHDSDGVELSDVLGAGRLVYDAVSVMHVACSQSTQEGAQMQVRCLKSRFSATSDEAITLAWDPACGSVGGGDRNESTIRRPSVSRDRGPATENQQSHPQGGNVTEAAQ